MTAREASSARSRRIKRIKQFAGGPSQRARLLPFLPSLLLVLLLACCVAWGTFVGFARLAGFDLSLWRPELGSIPAARLFDVTRAAATGVGVLAGVFAIVYAYRRQRVQEADSQREDGEQLSERYQDSAGQLGHDKAAVRLAGVYAMSRLADDWADQRQQCVDVLCAYIRLPVAEDQSAEEKVVRRTILDEITSHTSVERAAETSWSSLRLDLSNSCIEDFGPRNSVFSDLSVHGARLEGDVEFFDTSLTGRLDLGRAVITGRVGVAATGRAGEVSAFGARVLTGGSLNMTASAPSSKSNTFADCAFDYITVEEGGAVAITLSPGAGRGAFGIGGMKISGELRIYGDGEECAERAITTRELQTLESGKVIVQKELLNNPQIFSHGIRDAGAGPISLQVVQVGPWTVVDLD